MCHYRTHSIARVNNLYSHGEARATMATARCTSNTALHESKHDIDSNLDETSTSADGYQLITNASTGHTEFYPG